MRGTRDFTRAALSILLTCVLHVGTASRSAAEDVVWRRSTDSDRVYASRGTIRDYTGETLTLDGTRIPADRVVRIDTEWHPSHVAGDAALAKGEFANALASYRVALTKEQRRWARRLIFARTIECYGGEGNLAAAGAAFVALVKDDPTTKAFDTIPLLWYASSKLQVDASQAQMWITSKDPVARLIGASHLINSPDRAAALDTLEALSILKDTRIALLAQGQIWRTRIAASKPHETEQWAKAVDKLPETLRAGPTFVVARAFAHHGQAKRAVEMYMRVPILHPKQYHLAAQSLWEAGELLARLERKADAERCYREILKDYRGSFVAESAERKLREAAKPGHAKPK